MAAGTEYKKRLAARTHDAGPLRPATDHSAATLKVSFAFHRGGVGAAPGLQKTTP